jgi:hypothetical protein
MLLCVAVFFSGLVNFEVRFLFDDNAFGESLSFDAQKKVTKEKGTLPLMLRKRKEASAQQPLLLVTLMH